MSYDIECLFGLREDRFSRDLLKQLLFAIYAVYEKTKDLDKKPDSREIEVAADTLFNNGKGFEFISNKEEGKSVPTFEVRGSYQIPASSWDLSISICTSSSESFPRFLASDEVLIKLHIPDEMKFNEEAMENFLKSCVVAYETLKPGWGKIDHELGFDALRKEVNLEKFLCSGNFFTPSEVNTIGKEKILAFKGKAWKIIELSDGGILAVFANNFAQRNDLVNMKEVARTMGLTLPENIKDKKTP